MKRKIGKEWGQLGMVETGVVWLAKFSTVAAVQGVANPRISQASLHSAERVSPWEVVLLQTRPQLIR